MAKGFRLRFLELGLGLLVIAGGCSLPMARLKSDVRTELAEVEGSHRQFVEEAANTQRSHISGGETETQIPPHAIAASAVKDRPSQPAFLPQGNRPQTPSQGQDPDGQIISVDLLVAELEAEGLLDPASKAQLTADLCRTPPHLWQGVVEAFRASLEIRKRRESTRQFASGEVFVEDNDVRTTSYSSTTGGTVSQTPQTLLDRPSTDQNQSQVVSHVGASKEPVRNDPTFTSGTNRQETTQGTVNSAPPSEERPSSAATSQDSRRLPDRSVIQDTPGGETTISKSPSRFDEQIGARWDEWVKKGINGLEDQQDRSSTDEIKLRLLHLALANREKALEPIPGLSPSLQDFWSQTLFGVLLLEDTQLHSDRQLRLMEARRHLENGIRRLGEECPLEITGLAFVTSVQSWGVYEAFEQYEFSPGQKVLLYAEVENLASESTAKGYRTAWRSSYQILDATGKQIAQYEYPANEEFCRRPRRDFFIGCELSFPKDASPGRYTLRLTVVDMIKQRVGQGTVDFSIRSQPAR